MTQTDKHWPALILAYFIVQTLSRTFTGTSLGLDEAELMLTTQSLEWGYGPQPPLYSWLQYGLFALLGKTVFALALLKNSLLCLTYLVLFQLLRRDYDNDLAGLATLSLLLLPQIAWESQRALSHSVLATMMVVISFAAFARLCRKPAVSSYLLFGISIALGILSKLNFLLLPLAILFAALTLPETRRRVLSPRILLSFGIGGAILAFPAKWLINHQSSALSSAHKFKISQSASPLQAALDGIFSLSMASFAFLALLLAVLSFLYLRYRRKEDGLLHQPVLVLLMSRTVIFALLLTLLLVLASGTTNVKDRWLQPALVLAAPAIVLWLLPKLPKLAWYRLQQVVFAAALLVSLILPLHNRYGDLKKPSRRNAPFSELATAITAKYPATELIFAQTNWLGGNLQLKNANWTVTVPRKNPESPHGRAIFVWQSDSPQPPQAMLDGLQNRQRGIVTIEPGTKFAVPYPLNPESTLSVYFTSVQFE